jgi:hypothetical protein
VVYGGVVVDFWPRTEPAASFFRKTQPPPSAVLEKFFIAENYVSGFKENLALLSIENCTPQKNKTPVSESNEKIDVTRPKPFLE